MIFFLTFSYSVLAVSLSSSCLFFSHKVKELTSSSLVSKDSSSISLIPITIMRVCVGVCAVAGVEVFHPSQRRALGLNKNLSIPVTVALHTNTHSQFGQVFLCVRDKVYGEDRNIVGVKYWMRQTEGSQGNKEGDWIEREEKWRDWLDREKERNFHKLGKKCFGYGLLLARWPFFSSSQRSSLSFFKEVSGDREKAYLLPTP